MFFFLLIISATGSWSQHNRIDFTDTELGLTVGGRVVSAVEIIETEARGVSHWAKTLGNISKLIVNPSRFHQWRKIWERQMITLKDVHVFSFVLVKSPNFSSRENWTEKNIQNSFGVSRGKVLEPHL